MIENSLHSAGLVADYLEMIAKTVTIADGYETDIGTRVFAGRRKIDDEMVPCFVVHETEDRITARQGGRAKVEVKTAQRYVLIGYDRCDPDQPNKTAHKIIRDLKKLCFAGGHADGKFGGMVYSVTYMGKDIGARPDGVGIVTGLIEIDVEFVETLSSP